MANVGAQGRAGAVDKARRDMVSFVAGTRDFTMRQTEKKTRNGDCTVLVCSCDMYADLLPPFAALWRKFWPDCPFEVVLVTETAPADPLCFDRVLTNPVGETWCRMLVAALRQVETPYVMLLMDDYFLTQTVETTRIARRLDDLKRLGGGNLRLIPNPPVGRARAARLEGEDNLFRYRPQTAYCVATQAGFWRRDYLCRLAERQRSAWEFERCGSFDPLTAERPILVTGAKEFPFVDAVHKGYWETFGLAACRAAGIDTRGFTRTRPPLKVRLVEGVKAIVFALVPMTLLVRFQNRFALGATSTPAAGGK